MEVQASRQYPLARRTPQSSAMTTRVENAPLRRASATSSSTRLSPITPIKNVSSQLTYRQQHAVNNYLSVSEFQQRQAHQTMLGVDIYA